MNVGQLVGGIALGVGAGVASGLVMKNFMYDHANVTPDVRHKRRENDAGGYGAAMPGSLAVLGTVGASIGGVSLLAKGGPALAGIGLLGAAGLLAGGLVGGVIGASGGGKAAHESYDPTISEDVDKLMARYDKNDDGELSIAEPDGVMPEFMFRNGHEPNHYIGVTGISSIEAFAKRADANSDEVVTRQELVDLLTSYDDSGNGKLNGAERGGMTSDGLYERS